MSLKTLKVQSSLKQSFTIRHLFCKIITDNHHLSFSKSQKTLDAHSQNSKIHQIEF